MLISKHACERLIERSNYKFDVNQAYIFLMNKLQHKQRVIKGMLYFFNDVLIELDSNIIAVIKFDNIKKSLVVVTVRKKKHKGIV